MNNPVHFYFDFSSPYSYIANEWVDALAARHGRVVQRHAMLLGATFQAAELKSPVSYPLKGAYSVRDFARSARFEGLPYALPKVFPIPTQNAARIFWWLAETQGPEAAADWTRAGLRAVFVHGAALNDADTLKALAAENGIASEQAEAVCNDPVWKLRLKRENDEAIAAGIFGAPFFVIDGEPFWGNDRKPQIERWLASGPF
jgi:2-hydroxychromene-2-carboxylate isomerase